MLTSFKVSTLFLTESHLSPFLDASTRSPNKQNLVVDMDPVILFIPGFWEGPTVFEEVISLLQSTGFKAQVAALPSTRTVSPGNPDMNDDIAAVRSAVQNLVDAGEDVLLVLHSGGGFIGSSAIEGLTVRAREEQGLRGDVTELVFLSGAIFPKGFTHDPLPFQVTEVLGYHFDFNMSKFQKGLIANLGRGDVLRHT